MPTKLSDLNIPMMGSVENARLLQWFVEEGATFSKGDVLYELETDKAVAEVEADGEGILVRRLASEGDDFKMGDRVGLLASVDTPANEIEQALSAWDHGSGSAGDERAAPVTEVPSTLEQDRPAASVKSSPRSRKIAREHGIDIASVTATGSSGRVTGEDVLRAVSSMPEQAPPSTDIVAAATPGADEGTRVPHSLRRKTIAQKLSKAMREAPHLTADMDMDLTSLMTLRRRYRSNGRTAPSILAFFATTAARLLMQHKQLNAIFREEDTVLWNTVNLNIGVDTDQGLLVPVIRDAQLLGAAEMSVRIADMANKARRNELSADDMTGGTFTISNPGSIGPVVRAEAVLNGTQVALMGMPGIANKPVAVEMTDGNYAIQVRPIIRIGITFDHRALDGGPVIRFLNALKNAIEAIDT